MERRVHDARLHAVRDVRAQSRRADAALDVDPIAIADSALLTVKLLKNATLKVHEGFPHGMLTTHADVINPELLSFIEEGKAARPAARPRSGGPSPTPPAS